MPRNIVRSLIAEGDGPDSLRIPWAAMTTGPFAFLWQVPTSGFHWDSDMEPIGTSNPESRSPAHKHDRAPWLTTSTPMGVGFDARQYSPLTKPQLFREFARLAPSHNLEQYAAFASKWGHLGYDTVLHYPNLSKQPLNVGESRDIWDRETAAASLLLHVHDAVSRRDTTLLSEMIVWNDQAVAFQVPNTWNDPLGQQPGSWSVIAHRSVQSQRELLGRWKVGDLIEPARYYVHKEVNDKLKGRVSPAVLPFRRGEIAFFPESLLASLYLLFALELSGRRQQVECQGCGEYFTPGRANQRYHNDRCRKTAFNSRQRIATTPRR